jgi:putative endonuclease
MNKNIEIGKFGEEIASKYLKRNGYEILVRNYRKKFGEIDIITKNSGELIFFEIKTLLITKKDQIKPEDNFTTQKEIKVKRICQFFVAENPHLVDEEFGWRIDVLSIEISLDRKIILRHYKNV